MYNPNHVFERGIAVGMVLGGLIMVTVLFIILCETKKDMRKSMVSHGIAEYRINKTTGESLFYMFTVESGKVVN